MAVTLTVNGVNYPFPENNDENWGTNVTNWATSVSQSTLQKSGGTFTLTAEVDFGANFGLKALYLKSRGANVASSGVIRLANTEALVWRSAANSGDKALTVNASDKLEFDGSEIATDADIDGLDSRLTTAESNITTLQSEVSTTQSDISALQSGKQDVDSDLTAIAGLSANGLVARTGSGTAAVRAITGTTNKISVTNGDGLSGNPTVNIGSDVVTLTDPQTLTNKTTTNLIANGTLTGTAVKDEDNMSSNSDTAVPTQQSVKAYVDAQIASAGNVTYSAKSADYTVTTSDAIRTIGMTTSSADRTVTLPAAASSTNRILTIKKVDSGTGQVIVDGNGSETIDGALTIKLFLQYESVTIQCDGSGWVILDYRENNKARSYTLTIGGSTTAPTPGSGATTTATWSRNGNKMLIQYSFNQSTAGSAGSGVYTFPLPSGYSVDTSKYQNPGTSNGVVGESTSYDGTTNFFGSVNIYDSNKLYLAQYVDSVTPAKSAAIGSGFNPLSTSSIRFSFTAEIYITEFA